ncbi:MAG: type II secretion system F family protein [Candidatus Aminicenantes bacterium]|nr:MAG: type II secretion system F family protein [Candidatus Aminicenantes bacterium]
MAVFIWKGRNRLGDVVEGERLAKSAADLTRILQREQVTVINVKKKPTELKIPFLKREKVPLKELAVYSRQLSVLIDADLPLIQGLSMLAQQTKNKYFKSVITQVRKDVEAGATLNQAKKKFPKVFDDLYCNLVASGEQSGSLDIMLRRLADYQERIVKLKAQVKQAMTYPIVIFVFSILVTIFMLWKVVPIFSGIFDELGADMPLLSQIMLAASNFIQSYIFWMFIGFIGFVFLFRYFKKTPPGRRAVDTALLKMPLFGDMIEKVALSRITRTLSTLLSGGVPMMESLKITSSTAGNVLLEGRIMQSRAQVAEGTSLMDAFKEKGQFPLVLTQMVGVGEATGTLDAMLTKLADFYDDEVEATVGALLSILEPILLIFVGALIGTIVISMYLPVFSLIAQFG